MIVLFIKQTGCPVLSICYRLKMSAEISARPRSRAQKTHQRPRRHAQQSARCRRSVVSGARLSRFQHRRPDGSGRRHRRRAASPFPDQEGAGPGGDRGAGRRRRRRTWIAPVQAAGSAREGIRAVFEAVATELEQQGFVRGCPLNNLAHELSLADPDFRAALAGIFAAWRQAIADKVRTDQQAGREQDTDPDRFAASRSPPIPAPCRWPRRRRTPARCAIAWRIGRSTDSAASSLSRAGAKRRRRVLLRPGKP